MKINLIYNKNISNYTNILTELENALLEKEVDFQIFELESMENYGDFTIVIGGDGTLLRVENSCFRNKFRTTRFFITRN